ncbi:MAG: HAMP domain-containing histidine kinase [Lentimicrobiaceae bacterium]|jgi:signal transduction histidine kinase|nr:HAMP domain-containing histidine kinase [Lentimicrobiaceae bacterium]
MKSNLYSQKKRWKIILSTIALVIICISIYYTNTLVNHFARQEKRQIEVWAEAVQRHAEMMKYTEKFFLEVSEQERHSVELFAAAYRQLLAGSANEKLDFYFNIIRNNKTIPVIITDDERRIKHKTNLSVEQESADSLYGTLLREFSLFKPIRISLGMGKNQWLYYTESRIYTELKAILDDLYFSFLHEVTGNAVSAPVIITDSTRQNVIQFGNLPEEKMTDSLFVEQQIKMMVSQNEPITIDLLNYGKSYVFYRSSNLLTQMKFYPFIQIILISLLIFVAYLLFSYARRSEQNQVWAGMAKETAHQIGTPLSSLMAWNELLKCHPNKIEGIEEMEKDIQRLEIITERFSKIGSPPMLKPTNINPLIIETIDYFKKRSSQKITFETQLIENKDVLLPLNASLFRWVIENLIKNAIDAMNGVGKITVKMHEENHTFTIDISDTGKGIPKSEFKQVFNPGFTTKKRGWGLGLSLAKRIIKDYHKGKIFVKSSVINQGTTFRMVLNK